MAQIDQHKERGNPARENPRKGCACDSLEDRIRQSCPIVDQVRKSLGRETQGSFIDIATGNIKAVFVRKSRALGFCVSVAGNKTRLSFKVNSASVSPAPILLGSMK